MRSQYLVRYGCDAHLAPFAFHLVLAKVGCLTLAGVVISGKGGNNEA